MTHDIDTEERYRPALESATPLALDCYCYLTSLYEGYTACPACGHKSHDPYTGLCERWMDCPSRQPIN